MRNPRTRYLTALMTLALVARPGLSGAECLAFTELMIDPTTAADAAGEWFEITNYGDQDVDLVGFTVADSAGAQSFTLEHSIVVEAHAFVLFARSADETTNGGVFPDFAYGTAVPLANQGDTIALFDPAGTLVDLVGYTADQVAPGQALACTIGHRTLNDSPSAWYLATTPYGFGDRGTPGQPNETYEAGECEGQVGIGSLDAPRWPVVDAPWPNPASDEVSVMVASDGIFEASVVNAAGRQVRRLRLPGRQAAGRRQVRWDGRDEVGRDVPAGTYWIRIAEPGYSRAQPVTVLP